MTVNDFAKGLIDIVTILAPLTPIIKRLSRPWLFSCVGLVLLGHFTVNLN